MAITGSKKKEVEMAENGTVKKRKLNEDEKPTKTIHEYQGYSFQTDANPQVPVVQKMDSQSFFDQYVSQRKPCVLDALPTLPNGNPIEITRPLLEQLAGSQTIQVERRPDAASNFGQNRTAERQVHLTIQEFLKTLTDNKNGELYYWSTQEDTDDVFNVPCRQLVDAHRIPPQLELAGNLILSSCNLWMGRASNGASSGLHHDYHDNFYLLLQGRKRFRLLSPDCAPQLATYGTMDRIHFNGRISYVHNEARADGVPLSSLEEEDDDNDDEEEEEIVLGKGFDYVSDDEEEGADFDETKDDFDQIMGEENDDQSEESKPAAATNNKDDDDHPDSFSRINPYDPKALQDPSFASCRQLLVELKAGQALYLPAGWFHEVTSYSDNDKKEEDCHMALNYWYHPPDAIDNFGTPYQHDYWKKEEAQRLKEQQEKKLQAENGKSK